MIEDKIEKINKLINFEHGATGILEIFPEKTEFTITFLLGKYYCTPPAQKYEIDIKNNFKISINLSETSILAYSAVDSLGYNYGNLHLFWKNLENEIKNLYIENKLNF